MDACRYCGQVNANCMSIDGAHICPHFRSSEYYKEPYVSPFIEKYAQYKKIENTDDISEVLELPERPKLTGGSSDYYKLPVGATDLLDLIEHKFMSFGLGNIFKACYRLGEKEGTSRKYDLEKIIFFAQRELDRA